MARCRRGRWLDETGSIGRQCNSGSGKRRARVNPGVSVPPVDRGCVGKATRSWSGVRAGPLLYADYRRGIERVGQTDELAIAEHFGHWGYRRRFETFGRDEELTIAGPW